MCQSVFYREITETQVDWKSMQRKGMRRKPSIPLEVVSMHGYKAMVAAFGAGGDPMKCFKV